MNSSHRSPAHVRNMAIGVDIGGTNIKIGIVNDQGEMLGHSSAAIFRNEDRTADLKFICRKVAELIEKHDISDKIAGIGVASPGILDIDRGIVKYAVNLGWKHLRLVEIMQEQLKIPVRLECDAVAGAIGEQKYGAGVNMSDFLFVCLGTGVGASLFAGNSFYQSNNGPAINIGHTSVIYDGKPCDCGNQGCLEKYVSATAITERVRTEMHTTTTSIQNALSESRILDSYLVYEAAILGDPYANQVFREAGHLLGVSLTNCIHLFGVSNIIIGGGLSQAGPILLDSTRKTVQERFPHSDIIDVNIVSGAYPTTAGILGAAAKWFTN